jgi:hypothetical protein
VLARVLLFALPALLGRSEGVLRGATLRASAWRFVGAFREALFVCAVFVRFALPPRVAFGCDALLGRSLRAPFGRALFEFTELPPRSFARVFDPAAALACTTPRSLKAPGLGVATTFGRP